MPPPAPPPPPPGLPIDGFLTLLLILGMLYGTKKIIKNNNG
ncbi:PID-CTERM protein-sorting domain-containing protein [Polaribacter sp. IC073]